MTGPRFSRPGDPPTEYEIQLLEAANDGDNDWLLVARQLMRNLGARQGATALLVVLDALGTEKTHVPARGMLFRMLYLPQRNAEIVRRLEAGDAPADVARDVGVSPRRVRQIGKRSGRRRRPNPVSHRA